MASKNPIINGLKNTLGYIELFPVLAVAAYEKNKGEGDQSPAMLLGLISVLLIVPAVAALVRYVAQAFKKDDNLTIRNALLPAAANCTNNSSALSSRLARRLKEEIGLHNSTFLAGGFTGMAQGMAQGALGAFNAAGTAAGNAAGAAAKSAKRALSRFTAIGGQLEGDNTPLLANEVARSPQVEAAHRPVRGADKLGAAKSKLVSAERKLQRAEENLNKMVDRVSAKMDGKRPGAAQQFEARIPKLKRNVEDAKAGVEAAKGDVKAAMEELSAKTPGRTPGRSR